MRVITATLDFLGSEKEWVNMFLGLMLGLNRLGKEWEYGGVLAIALWVIVHCVQRLLLPTLWSFAPEQFVIAGFDAKAVWVTVNFTFPTSRELNLFPIFTMELSCHMQRVSLSGNTSTAPDTLHSTCSCKRSKTGEGGVSAGTGLKCFQAGLSRMVKADVLFLEVNNS